MSLVLNRSRQVPADETPAFGGIAERFRRAGDLERAVALCRDGLKKFPDHLSARVTLGWALLDLGRYDEAQVELEQVLKRAPDNLAAIRGLAELHERAENAVVVPIDDQETAEAAQALEAANTPAHEHDAVSAPIEKTPAAHEPAGKRGKAAHASSHPVESPAVKAKAEPDARSMFAQTVAASEAEPAQAKHVAAPTPEPAPVSSPAAAEIEPQLPSLEDLAAQFEATSAAFEAAPPPPPAPSIIEPVVVEPVKPPKKAASEMEPARPLTQAAAPPPVVEPAPAIEPVQVVQPVVTIEPALEDPPAIPIAAAVAMPEPVLDDLPPMEELLPSSTTEPMVATEDVVLDAALEPEAAMLDLAADTTIPDADALIADAALLATPDIEPIGPLPEPAADLAATHAAMLAEQVSATSEAHPEPDVNELLAQLAQEPHADIEPAPAAMFTAEPAPLAHPEPDISDLVAELAHEPVDLPSTVFAADPFPLSAEAHPEPHVIERASAVTPITPIDAFEHAPLTSSEAPDFLAAMEATMQVEPAAPDVVVETGPVFELSGEPPAAPVFEAIPEIEVESDPLPASMAPRFDFDAPVPVAPPAAIAAEAAAPPASTLFAVSAPVAAPEMAVPLPAPVAAAPAPAAAPPEPVAAPMPIFAPASFVTPPAPAAQPASSRAVKSKSKRHVAALEKMLRQIASRRLELASQYRSS